MIEFIRFKDFDLRISSIREVVHSGAQGTARSVIHTTGEAAYEIRGEESTALRECFATGWLANYAVRIPGPTIRGAGVLGTIIDVVLLSAESAIYTRDVRGEILVAEVQWPGSTQEVAFQGADAAAVWRKMNRLPMFTMSANIPIAAPLGATPIASQVAAETIPPQNATEGTP